MVALTNIILNKYCFININRVMLLTILCRHIRQRSRVFIEFRFKKRLNIFLCVVNIIFTFSQIIIGSRHNFKIYYDHFMIMVLSCSDLISVVTNHLGILILLSNLSYLIFREDYYLLPKMRIYLNISEE